LSGGRLCCLGCWRCELRALDRLAQTSQAGDVAEHVELSYFTTVHGTQGLTRDVAGTLVDELAGFRSLYVGMTRGRERNTAYVVLGDSEQQDTARAALERTLRVGDGRGLAWIGHGFDLVEALLVTDADAFMLTEVFPQEPTTSAPPDSQRAAR
jgi:hypothetical protein